DNEQHAARIESEDSYRSTLQVSPAAQALSAKAHRDLAPPNAVETLHVRICAT
ncbi:hypothetical protein L195_g051195, partial [Trifolium pratense]